MNPKLERLVEVMSLLVLVMYVGAFGWFAVSALLELAKASPAATGLVLNGPLGPAATNEAVAYVWTAVSVLVGSVVAVAYGQPVSQSARDKLGPERLIVYYAWAFIIVGCLALLVWIYVVSKTGTPPLLIKNAATAFFGLMVPILSAYLKLPKDSGTRQGSIGGSRFAKAGLTGGGFGLCADFAAYPTGTPFPNQFRLAGLTFTNEDPLQPWQVGTGDQLQGLRFHQAGCRIGLPIPLSAVDVTVGTFAGDIEITALDGAGGVLASMTVLGTNSWTSHHLAAEGIETVVLSEGGEEGLLKEICVLIPA